MRATEKRKLAVLFPEFNKNCTTIETHTRKKTIGHVRKKAREIVRKNQSLKSTQMEMFETFDLLPF